MEANDSTANDSTQIWNDRDGKHRFNVRGWSVIEYRNGTVDMFNSGTGDQFYTTAEILRNIVKELKS